MKLQEVQIVPALASANEMIPKHVIETSEIFHTSLRSQKKTAKQIHDSKPK